MLKRIKKLIELSELDDKIIERAKVIKKEESPNGVFFDEGSTAELEELKKADEGTLPWYKRILRHE